MRTPVHISVAAGLLIFHAVNTGAEEYLIRETGKYLGWQIPNDKFRACGDEVLDIGKGRIKKTSDKCRTLDWPRASLEWKGTLVSADGSTGIVRIQPAEGKAIDLYLPRDSVSWGRLKSVSTGGQVRAVGPVPGRAERVVTDE
jgi:hypothetical protein